MKKEDRGIKPWRKQGFLIGERDYRVKMKKLVEPLLAKYYDHSLRIPMINDARSLNLGNSVAITLYEAIRQTGFENLLTEGNLRDSSLLK